LHATNPSPAQKAAGLYNTDLVAAISSRAFREDMGMAFQHFFTHSKIPALGPANPLQ
jgi:hypothetical protein